MYLGRYMLACVQAEVASHADYVQAVRNRRTGWALVASGRRGAEAATGSGGLGGGGSAGRDVGTGADAGDARLATLNHAGFSSSVAPAAPATGPSAGASRGEAAGASGAGALGARMATNHRAGFGSSVAPVPVPAASDHELPRAEQRSCARVRCAEQRGSSWSKGW